MKKVLVEASIVAVLAAAIAFAANALSPRGLSLKTDYFPGGHEPASAQEPDATLAPLSPTELLAARFASKGLQLANSNRVAALFADPRRGQDMVVFLDARNDEHYQAGHIPGAFQFDHYHLENYLASIMPVCQSAQVIVVYCNGGECEDSEFAAIKLGELGIAKEKILVYGGGITEWTNSGRQIETGARNSGNLQPSSR